MRNFEIFLTDLTTYKPEGEPRPTTTHAFSFNPKEPVKDTALVVADARILLKKSAIMFAPQSNSIWGLEHAQVENIRKKPKKLTVQ